MNLPFRTVLCPTDLSPSGDAAIAIAHAVTADGGTVHLLHVCVPVYVTSPLDATPILALPSTPEGQDKIEKKAMEELLRRTPVASAARGVHTERRVVHEGDPAAAIEREAARVGADAIVLGTHGRSGLARALLGSVASAVLSKAKRPVAWTSFRLARFHAGA